MSDPKIVLVTGGSGLVGRAVRYVIENEQNRADEKWIFLSSKDADLQDASQTDALMEKYKPTHVLHLAAVFGGLYAMMSNHLEYYRINMKINMNVLESAQKYGVKKVASGLSANVFPSEVTYPITEDMIHLGPPDGSNYGYAYAKRMIDVYGRTFSNVSSCLFTGFIPPNIYGPYDKFGLKDANALPAFVHKAYCAKRDNVDHLVVFGSGRQRRQFIYSRDLARLIIWVVREYEETEPITLSVDEELENSLKEVAEIIAENFGVKKIVFDTSKPDGQVKKTMSVAKLRHYLPDFEFTDIKQGIKETCDWFRENYDIARI